MINDKIKFNEIVKRAKAAGEAAGAAIRPAPLGHITVQACGDTKHFYEPHGACGFAWVVVKPNKGAFAKFLKDHAGFEKHYHGGISHWIHYGDQEVDRKYAYAKAYAAVIDEVDGYNVFAVSRLD
jgi:hypothetical protein